MNCLIRKISVTFVFGYSQCCSRFVPNFSEIAAPLVELTNKQFSKRQELEKHWGPAQSKAITQSKEVMSPPVLHFPEFSKEFVIHVDASEAGVGAFLSQNADDKCSTSDLRIIARFSKRFTQGQKHSSATMKECCGVMLALQHSRQYIWGRHFKCVTNHAALTHLCYMQDISNMLTRWAIAF